MVRACSVMPFLHLIASVAFGLWCGPTLAIAQASCREWIPNPLICTQQFQLKACPANRNQKNMRKHIGIVRTQCLHWLQAAARCQGKLIATTSWQAPNPRHHVYYIFIPPNCIIVLQINRCRQGYWRAVGRGVKPWAENRKKANGIAKEWEQSCDG